MRCRQTVTIRNIPLAFAISPNGCAIRCMAVGAMHNGIDIGEPNTVVSKSSCDTFTIIRGRNRNLMYTMSLLYPYTIYLKYS